MMEVNFRTMSIIFLIFLSVFLFAADASYFGGWPTNPNKDTIKDPGFNLDCESESDKKKVGCPCSENDDCYSGKCFNSPRAGKYCLQSKGTLFPQYKLVDQYGEIVDIYDFANQGKIILIEFSTSWCQPCRDFASWLTFDDPSVTSHPFWKKEYDIIKDLIRYEKIYFINIQIQDRYKEPSSLKSIEEWVYEYPDEMTPIFSDTDYNVRNWMKVTAYPTMIVLDEKMEILKFSIRGWQDALNFISQIDWNFDNDVNNIKKQ